jgi:intracellular sulfur oxidation DsrE/DsrF family protein
MPHQLQTLRVCALLLGVAVLSVLAVSLSSAAPPEGKKSIQVVIHVNFPDAKRQGHGLKNVENILKDVHDDANVEVVCHGAGITLLLKSKSEHAAKIEDLMKKGVRFAACENTLREKAIARDDLLSGVATVPSGAVEVIRKQQQGYAYFKP